MEEWFCVLHIFCVLFSGTFPNSGSTTLHLNSATKKNIHNVGSHYVRRSQPRSNFWVFSTFAGFLFFFTCHFKAGCSGYHNCLLDFCWFVPSLYIRQDCHFPDTRYNNRFVFFSGRKLRRFSETPENAWKSLKSHISPILWGITWIYELQNVENIHNRILFAK